ncbi:twin-arginine translocase subunit TatB [Caldichromatium japonicum]|uniref:Sec-independent protein translocase protein TatB n=1 Tax=Caldichromatium japonicum TaxID=2699430 RepID=A0A6G7VFE3_9GAMM|nr:Sec-independent protein translocase protein TatB [Caldichromatium japonicum]QIK38672.1 twin-arginine translocase subunit TatB [Caldichromatium japonicum]
MFDIGFQELLLVAVVALVVVGPERLPHLARVAGKWVGRARRTLIGVQQEIERELKAEELKRILDEQAQRRPLETILEETSGKMGGQTSAHTPPAAPAPISERQPAASDPSGGRQANRAASGPGEQTTRP